MLVLCDALDDALHNSTFCANTACMCTCVNGFCNGAEL